MDRPFFQLLCCPSVDDARDTKCHVDQNCYVIRFGVVGLTFRAAGKQQLFTCLPLAAYSAGRRPVGVALNIPPVS